MMKSTKSVPLGCPTLSFKAARWAAGTDCVTLGKCLAVSVSLSYLQHPPGRWGMSKVSIGKELNKVSSRPADTNPDPHMCGTEPQTGSQTGNRGKGGGEGQRPGTVVPERDRNTSMVAVPPTSFSSSPWNTSPQTQFPDDSEAEGRLGTQSGGSHWRKAPDPSHPASWGRGWGRVLLHHSHHGKPQGGPGHRKEELPLVPPLRTSHDSAPLHSPPSSASAHCVTLSFSLLICKTVQTRAVCAQGPRGPRRCVWSHVASGVRPCTPLDPQSTLPTVGGGERQTAAPLTAYHPPATQ